MSSLLIQIQRCYRSLLLHRMRTLLSTLGILFGVVAVVAMLSIGEGAKRETLEQIEQLGTSTLLVRQAELSEEQASKALQRKSKGLSTRDVDLFERHVPYVENLAPIKYLAVGITGTKREITPQIMTTTRAFAEIRGLSLSEGRFITDHDVQNRARVCVLGYEIAAQLGTEGHVGDVIRIEGVPFTIAGILDNVSWKKSKNGIDFLRNVNHALILPLEAEKSLPLAGSLAKDPLSAVMIKLQHRTYTPLSAQVIRRMLAVSHDGVEDFEVVIPQELVDQANKTQRTFNLVLGSIAAISLLVGGIGIMNIMLANVSERTREIGIRRAVGANQRHIIVQFLWEALLLTLTGAFAGVVLGVAFTWMISFFAMWKTVVTFWSILLSFGMAGGVGICAGMYPAIQAAKMDPISALRHVA